MENYSEFESICPYNDEDAVKALGEVSNHPALPMISKALFPNEPLNFLSNVLRSLHSIDEFQQIVMFRAISWCIDNTISDFSYSGVENLADVNGRFLLMSNHRDIILDPALTQYILFKSDYPMTEICVGDNLLSSKTIENLLRSNRMIKVIRGISARELYLSSQLLSKYIRQTITSNKASVWIAQRQGRTKDGIDITEQGLLKMVDMSGTGSFEENFKEINLVPVSISYEYEPCDIRKAREILISRTQKYVKGPREDLHSIIMGIRQQKGQVHLEIGKPLTDEEIRNASQCDKNDRYQAIKHAVDVRVIQSYKLWKTNYMAWDIVNDSNRFADKYSEEDLTSFKKYIEHKLNKVERSLDRNELRDILLHIYSNPVDSKDKYKD